MVNSKLPFEALHHTRGKSDVSSHVKGTTRGEGWIKKGAREPGRRDEKFDRTARDSTSIKPSKRNPIDPRMPPIPPP